MFVPLLFDFLCIWYGVLSMGEFYRCVCSCSIPFISVCNTWWVSGVYKRNKHEPACGIYIIYNGPLLAINWNQLVRNLFYSVPYSTKRTTTAY